MTLVITNVRVPWQQFLSETVSNMVFMKLEVRQPFFILSFAVIFDRFIGLEQEGWQQNLPLTIMSLTLHSGEKVKNLSEKRSKQRSPPRKKTATVIQYDVRLGRVGAGVRGEAKNVFDILL